VEYTTGRSAPWRVALRRAARILLPRRRGRGWSVLVPLIAALAGLLFTVNVRTAAGTSLRDDRRTQLSALIVARNGQVSADEQIASRLRHSIENSTAAQAGSDHLIAEQQRRIDQERAAAELTTVHGPGLTVLLDDAPRRPDGSLPVGARPDDVVVHQQDVQSVVNALWAGGAEAMTIMGVRVISTSAVRCVGNTLLLHGRVYSPPFTIQAIGDPAALRRALDGDGGVAAFISAVRAFGLGYQVRDETDLVLPGYDGSVVLDHATPSA
jgi:uncharacterized protein YlxW (UPF0749 family)